MSATTPTTPRHTNRLTHEKSPYLLQHSHNPVDWYPWGPEALAASRTQDKPLFLSVGYSACHWCHVMERESFENEAIAQLLNQHFISVKVDREERPDIDEIYMTAVQMMTGQGGWPMSVFLLPDGRPFYGGTYFPPEGRHGRVGFASLIVQLAEAYHNRRTEVEQVAVSITEDLQQATRQRPLAAPAGPLDPIAFLRAAVTDLEKRFDAENGGFGGAPKFPPHHALRLLCESMRLAGEGGNLLLTTLDKMALGGIYDHIGGGFHRYSTDAVWLLPHFEKMLYDNALLARVYADAFTLTDREAYARIARETCDWVLRDMTDPTGGFHAALDADSEGEEGKYYVWTPDEVIALLGEEAGKAFCHQYNIQPGGNFHDEATRRATGHSIPHLALGESSVVLPNTLEPGIADSREKLRLARDKRIPPGKDDKVITSWNGLMIGALAFAGNALNEPRYIEAAKRAAEFCLTTLRHNGELLRRYARGDAGLPAFLDDYAYLADGLLDLYAATREERWADEARSLADTLLESFWDREDGGFFFAGSGHEELIARSKDLFDGALPSANGVAARVLARLGKLPGGDRYRDNAQALLHIYRGMLHRAPNGTHSLALAALEAFMDDTEAPLEPVTLLTEGRAERTFHTSDTATLTFILRMAPGYHVNARRPSKEYLIPTIATLTTDLPATFGPVTYPDAVQAMVAGDLLPVYEGDAHFTLPLTLPEDALPGNYSVTLTIRCQPCNESACLPPTKVKATLAVTVGGNNA